MLKRILFSVTILILPSALFPQDRITGRDFATRSEVIAQYGMAATSQPLATQAALDILKKGEQQLTQQLPPMQFLELWNLQVAA